MAKKEKKGKEKKEREKRKGKGKEKGKKKIDCPFLEIMICKLYRLLLLGD